VRARRWIVALAAAALLAGGGVLTAARRAPASTEVARPSAGADPRSASLAHPGVHHYMYVFPDGRMYVYDIDHGQRLVQTVELPGIVGIRGVAASPATHTLYVSYGGDGDGYDGSLVAIDLISGRQLWDQHYSTGVDSMAIDRAGRRIYLPDGELSRDGIWNVIDARTGGVIGRISGGLSPHDTVIGASGRWVYLGGRNSPYLDVASTRTDRVVRRIGPLRSGVRPFTINGAETLAFTTATGFLGFQVSSLRSGRVLYTETFGRRFKYDPATFAPSTPSHGISLSPDERRVWVIDAANGYVHVFDVAGLPRRRPREVASIRLTHPLSGEEAGCSYDCLRDGWLLHSRSGCFVYVGDSGEVIDTRTLRSVAFLAPLRNTRQLIEIDWRGGAPVATTSRTGVGYVRPGARPGRQSCR